MEVRYRASLLVALLSAILLSLAASAAGSDAETIEIQGDEELRALAEEENWPGHGTKASPFLLEGYSFEIEEDAAIHVAGTTLHLIISSNRVLGPGSGGEPPSAFGVLLEKTENVTVEANQVSSVPTGVRVTGTQRTVLSGNRIEDVRTGLDLSMRNSPLAVESNRITDAEDGVSAASFGEIRIADNRIGDSDDGISLAGSGDYLVENNTLTGNKQGIDAGALDEAEISGNTFVGNREGIQLFGTEDVRIEGNDFRHRDPGIQGSNVWNTTIRANLFRGGAGVSIEDSFRTTVENNRLTGGLDGEAAGTGRGIALGTFLSDHRNITVTGNRIDGPSQGIRVYRLAGGGGFGQTGTTVENVEVTDNIVSGVVSDGVDVSGAQNVTVAGNLVSSVASKGIEVSSVQEVTVEANTVEHSRWGLDVAGLDDATVRRNVIEGNVWGLRVSETVEGAIYDNLFDNARNAWVAGEPEVRWNVTPRQGPNIVGGPSIGGNYWSDHVSEDEDGDGFADDPYFPAETGVQAQPILGPISSHGVHDDLPLFQQTELGAPLR